MLSPKIKSMFFFLTHATGTVSNCLYCTLKKLRGRAIVSGITLYNFQTSVTSITSIRSLKTKVVMETGQTITPL